MPPEPARVRQPRSAVPAFAGVNPATIAEFSAPKSSAETACAWACERLLLWLDPPQVIKKREARIKVVIEQAIRTVAFRPMISSTRSTAACSSVRIRPHATCAALHSACGNRRNDFPAARIFPQFHFCTAHATLTSPVLDNRALAVLNRSFASEFQPKDFRAAKNFCASMHDWSCFGDSQKFLPLRFTKRIPQ